MRAAPTSEPSAPAADDTAPPRRLPGWRAGRILGVPLYIRPSTWITAAILFAALYAQLAPEQTGLGAAVVVGLAAITTVGFLASIVAHELAHAVLARFLGLGVHGVSVFYLGGVTQLVSEPEEPAEELAIAVAGPLTNLTIGAGLIALGASVGTEEVAGVLLTFLGEINAAIGLFNLLPGHPLDGGALLRAGLWYRTGDRLRAARITGLIGQGLALLMIGVGIIGTFRPGGAGGSYLWLAVVGMFMFTAARAGLVQTQVRERLVGVTVADVVTPAGWSAQIDWTVARVVADVTRSQAAGLVLDTGGRAVGAFGPRQLEQVPSGSWDHLTVGELMHETVGTVASETPLADVLPRFSGRPDGWLAVVDGGVPIGVLTSSDILARVQVSA